MQRWWHMLQGLFRLLPTSGAARLDRQLRMTNTRRVAFVSYLESSGYRTQHVDSYERSLRRRRMAKILSLWALAFAAVWVVLESARAVTLF